MSAFNRTSEVRSILPPPSRPPSVFSAASIDTLVADQSHRGFPSREAYLEALREFAYEKLYYESGEQLNGFYGNKTVDDYLDKLGSKKPRRSVAATLSTVVEGKSTPAPEPAPKIETKNTGSRLKKVFGRRKSVA
ncbi:uncharacterized protein Z518_09471 [Rhinocladiella mackenziei CBS 650.93]|uniref:Uncharacterized protein n=1 Tax=Rhinocladiella mackenziei CBS 650.93 TaxID=1442369 RepID=A0A0D2IYP9_9EURO|nr:uncharacterized protein Z518_09471 [Rhinocladiella mackenziei CBS 650.93]KIX01745.1 hypothetical protein Z518_09471 [Rhinocladiella mackenziei CBS 650.93]